MTGSTCSSFTSARSAVSSIPATAERAAVRSAIVTATASSSSSSSGGIAAPEVSEYPPAGPLTDSIG